MPLSECGARRGYGVTGLGGDVTRSLSPGGWVDVAAPGHRGCVNDVVVRGDTQVLPQVCQQIPHLALGNREQYYNGGLL